MEVHYINLQRRQERNERFLALNRAIAEFHRVDAVDGGCLEIADLVRQGVAQAPLGRYTPGALGCALSHRKMWQRCAAGADALTVAEDDAVFNRRFVSKAECLLAGLPPDWDIVLWGWNFDARLRVQIIEGVTKSVLWFEPGKLGPQVCQFQETDYPVIPLRLVTAFGTVCYSASPRGAGQLLKRCFPLNNQKIVVPGMRWPMPHSGIDALMNRHYGDLKSYVSFPPLVWTENDKSLSDISSRNPRRAGWNRPLWRNVRSWLGLR